MGVDSPASGAPPEVILTPKGFSHAGGGRREAWGLASNQGAESTGELVKGELERVDVILHRALAIRRFGPPFPLV